MSRVKSKPDELTGRVMESELVLTNLESAQIEKVRRLERELEDVCVITYEKPTGELTVAAGLPLPNLSDGQIDRLKTLESDFADICLLAFEVP